MPSYQNVVISLERLEGIKYLFDWSLVCHVASPTFPSSHARKFFVSTYENSVFSFILFLTKNICTYDCWVVFNLLFKRNKVCFRKHDFHPWTFLSAVPLEDEILCTDPVSVPSVQTKTTSTKHMGFH